MTLKQRIVENKELQQLPVTLKILFENLCRTQPNQSDLWVQYFKDWINDGHAPHTIHFMPHRVLMQDFTGVPAIVDLAAMRDAMVAWDLDPTMINPQCQVDLVIDHSVINDITASPQALAQNQALEFERNQERYQFLKWGQETFSQFRVVPPGTGICHQVNLEYLAEIVIEQQDASGQVIRYPDSLVGTDSHNTMINGLGILGWGVGGIEAEAVMLGQPITMNIPDVIGVQLTGQLKEGVTATDLVLTLTHQLRQMGVVGKFVEFFGSGVTRLTAEERATIANMSPEMGSTCAFFPVDEQTLDYLMLTGRMEAQVERVRQYTQDNHLWHQPSQTLRYTQCIELDVASIQPCVAGPKRPQDRVPLKDLPAFIERLSPSSETNGQMKHGDIVIASITSCTNTSNPDMLIAAGLVARAAKQRGLSAKPWVKTSFAPGSQIPPEYLKAMGLMSDLEALGFHLTGFGCTTCIGNSGPLREDIARDIEEHQVHAAAVLSGNRNFEGRVHPLTKTNWLASPPLVVVYAIVGRIGIDFEREPIGWDRNAKPVYLKDLWPSSAAIQQQKALMSRDMYVSGYEDVFKGNNHWQSLVTESSDVYAWQPKSTYIQSPPFFKDMTHDLKPLKDCHQAYVLAMFSDSITTDHISPAGVIATQSPAGRYLIDENIQPHQFNSYGSRRGNHEVMTRGTFANIRIKNMLTPDQEGGVTVHWPSGERMSIYEAAKRYQKEHHAMVVFAGKEYGSGSSRDWAAKGTNLLGVRVVIAESFERIHRSNLIGMGVLPCQFMEGCDIKQIALKGHERISILGIESLSGPSQHVQCVIHTDAGDQSIQLQVRLDTEDEWLYYQNGGILPYVMRQMTSDQVGAS